MASSNGRDRLSSRGQRVFAFGSSTPRDLSHLNKVLPAKLRNYDAKSTEKPEGPSLRDYIIRARSLSRETSNDQRNSFVFGSSTPRSFAHLDKIPTKQRVYDAKIPKKSATHSDFKAAPIRYNFAPPKTATTDKKDETRHVITSKDDDIASEPDIVQDREEFMEEMRRHKKKLEDSKKKVKLADTDDQKFGQVAEIQGNSQKTSRAQPKTHDESQIAVENRSANKMNDQIEILQLNGEEESEIEKNKPTKSVVEKVVNDVETVKNSITKSAENDMNSVKNIVADAGKAVKSEIENVKNTITKSVENDINSVKNVVADAGKTVKSEIENVKNEIIKTADTINNEVQDKVESTIDSLKNTISDSSAKM